VSQVSRAQAHARVAILTRHRGDSYHPEVVAAKIELEQLNLQELIKKTDQTRARLAMLRGDLAVLQGGDSG
jgi:hypothetical protein